MNEHKFRKVKSLESPLDCKETKPVNPKRNQPWIFIGRTDEAEAPTIWPPDAKSLLSGKDPDVRKDWRQEEKGTTEDEMVGWHHRLNGCEFEETPERTGKPGVLQSMGSQRVRHSWVTEQQLLVELLLLHCCFHLVWSVCLTVNHHNILSFTLLIFLGFPPLSIPIRLCHKHLDSNSQQVFPT